MTTLIRSGQKPGQPAFAAPAATAGKHRRRLRSPRARLRIAQLRSAAGRASAQGEGSWLTDVEGRRYLDLMSAYSAVSFGHAHPRIVAALTEQAHRLAVTSRAYFNDRLPLLLERLVAMTGLDRALPVNTGLEAVETAIKASRKWAHKVKGVPDGRAEIIGCKGNFHGRSITDRRACRPSRSTATASARIRRAVDDPVRRRRRARGRDHAEHRGVPRRAGAGRGRHRRAAGRLSRALRGDLPPPSRAADLRRGADRPRPHRPHVRLRSTTARCPTA